MDTPVFTIIIPTFNSGKTLSRALDSILSQRFNKFEIRVIDGLSGDNTINILKTYSSKDSRIFFSSEKDLGIYDAMNKGIDRANGKWLYFLGSDDQLHDQYVLEKIDNEARIGIYDVIYGNIMSESNGKYGQEYDYRTLLKNNISHQAMFFDKQVFKKIGRYNITLKTHADWDFNLRYFRQGPINIRYVDMVVADYAAGGQSATHEVKFFRDVLLPLRLQEFDQEIKSSHYSVKWFDEWWRFLRNAQIGQCSLPNDIKLPKLILLMADSQRKRSPTQLKNGFLSKYFMIITYVKYLLSRSINHNIHTW